MKRVLMFGLVVVLLVTVTAAWHPKRSYATPAVDAKIEIVWPHDEQGREAPVATAPFVNVEVYLFERGTLNPVPLGFDRTVRLWWALNQVYGETTLYGSLMPAHDLTPSTPTILRHQDGVKITAEVDRKRFPTWVFNDVPIERLRPDIRRYMGYDDELSKTYFFVEVVGADYRTNVWAHGADARSVLPNVPLPAQPNAVSTPVVDALVDVVWPHDGRGNQRPVSEATHVNVGVDLGEHPATGGWRSVEDNFNRPLLLLRSLNNGFLEPVGTAVQPVIESRVVESRVSSDRWTYSWPRWVFNNVDVSAAKDPVNKYYFAVQVDGVPTHTTIWAQGADARTYFPQKDIPARSAAD